MASAHPGRYLMGLGVSHGPLVKGYSRPYAAMTGYLDELDEAGVAADSRVLAALGPKMLKLSGERAAGAIPYLVTPEHTAHAREIFGEGPLLAPELKVVRETDPARARALARDALAMYLTLPNYTNNFLRHGFTEADLAEGGSDRLIDAVFAWGPRPHRHLPSGRRGPRGPPGAHRHPQGQAPEGGMAQARFSIGITASGNTETVVILAKGETVELPT